MSQIKTQYRQEENPVQPPPTLPDSGQRREFESGAVRDMAQGKGRCDLLPLDVAGKLLSLTEYNPLYLLKRFQQTGDVEHLILVFRDFTRDQFPSPADALLQIAQHFEAGAVKYGDNNWQRGIPVNVYIDSAIRHYLKFLRGDQDEPHDRAFCWNLMCSIWTCWHKPELNTYKREDTDA